MVANTSTAVPETPFPTSSAESGPGRRPRELPWLVTPAPSANQTVAAAATSSSRLARPLTTPAAATAGATGRRGGGGGSGGSGVRVELSRSESLASVTASEGCYDGDGGGAAGAWRTQQQWRGGLKSGGALTTAAASSSQGRDGNMNNSSNNNSNESGGCLDGQEVEDGCGAKAAVAAAIEDSEWARRRREALAYAGGMEAPVEPCSSASAGGANGVGVGGVGGGAAATGGNRGAEILPVLLFGVGSGSVGDESLSSGGGHRGEGVGPGGRGSLRGKVNMFGPKRTGYRYAGHRCPSACFVSMTRRPRSNRSYAAVDNGCLPA